MRAQGKGGVQEGKGRKEREGGQKKIDCIPLQKS